MSLRLASLRYAIMGFVSMGFGGCHATLSAQVGDGGQGGSWEGGERAS